MALSCWNVACHASKGAPLAALWSSHWADAYRLAKACQFPSRKIMLKSENGHRNRILATKHDVTIRMICTEIR